MLKYSKTTEAGKQGSREKSEKTLPQRHKGTEKSKENELCDGGSVEFLCGFAGGHTLREDELARFDAKFR